MTPNPPFAARAEAAVRPAHRTTFAKRNLLFSSSGCRLRLFLGRGVGVLVGLIFVFLSGIGIASGSFSDRLGCDFVRPFDSLPAHSVSRRIGGQGNRAHQRRSHGISAAARAPAFAAVAGSDHGIDQNQRRHCQWKAADQPSARPQRSCSIKMSALAAILFQRLGNNAHIGDARLLDRVHHGGEGAKRHIFIGAHKDRLVLRIANLLLQLAAQSR